MSELVIYLSISSSTISELNYWDQDNSWKKLQKFWNGPLCRYKTGPSPLINVAACLKSSNTKACAMKLSQILANNIGNGGRRIDVRIYVTYCLKNEGKIKGGGWKNLAFLLKFTILNIWGKPDGFWLILTLLHAFGLQKKCPEVMEDIMGFGRYNRRYNGRCNRRYNGFLLLRVNILSTYYALFSLYAVLRKQQ